MGQRQVVRALFTAALLFFLQSPAASAHRPIFTDGTGGSYGAAARIPDPEVSWAIYSAVGAPGEIEYYSFKADRGNALYAQVLVPKIDALNVFRPTLAVVGPALSIPPTDLPVELPSMTGALVVEYPPENAPDTFYEPFTQTSYWQLQEIRMEFPATGTYYLLVFDRELQVGKYVLAVGEREEFGIGDVVSFPVTWWRVHWWFGHGSYLVTAVASVLLVLILTTLAVLRRS